MHGPQARGIWVAGAVDDGTVVVVAVRMCQGWDGMGWGFIIPVCHC
jgi:hypothetical protein